MSGIEIAGFVLGIFPVLFHALESYREGAEVLLDWWRIQRAYKKCHHELSYHRLIFEGNVERFLLPLVVDDDELKALMDDPAGDAWEDRNLELRLQNRLPKSYPVFVELMNTINGLMEALKKELGVHNVNFQANFTQAGELLKPSGSRKDLLSFSNFDFQAKRIRFSLKKSTRERLFAQFQEANERMRNLLESCDQIAASRKSSQISKPPPSIGNRRLNGFWRHAKRLYEALSNAWQCSCPEHRTSLQLEHRTTEKVEFDVMFSMKSAVNQGIWTQTRIEMIPGAASSPAGVPIAVPPQAPGNAVARQVRWAVPTDGGSSKTAAAAATNRATTTTTSGRETKIEDLCSTLSKHCSDCWGFLDEDEHRFLVHPATGARSVTDQSIVTLDELLQDQHTLTRRKRYFLAFVLASSYLQLGSTPWLNAPITKGDILFIQDPDDPSPMAVEHPYMSCSFSHSGSAAPSQSMSSLGIRLLELCFGTPLETNRFRTQLPVGDSASAPILDYAAALQWSKMVGEEAGPEFADAIEWCLHAKEPRDGSWRKELWTNVIVPLESCHRQVSARAQAAFS